MISNKMCHYERFTLFGKVWNKKNTPRSTTLEQYIAKRYNVEPVILDVIKFINDEYRPTEIWDELKRDVFKSKENSNFLLLPPVKKWIAECKFLFKKVSPLPDELIESNQDYDNTLLEHMLWFFIDNKRVFKITEQLSHALLNTDVKNSSKINNIKLPYNTIYLSLPRGQLKLYCGGHAKSGEHSYSKSLNREDRIKIVEGVYLTLFGNILNITLITNTGKNITDEHIDNFKVNLESNYSIDELLKALGTKDCEDCRKGDSIATIEIIFKSIMYISSTNADIRKAAPYDIKKTNIKKFLKYPYRANSKLPCNIVGGNITISNNSSENNNSAKTGRKLTNRFMVRGHYHHFWMNRTEKITDNMVVKTNENGKVLVRKWIEPFWKGSEYADVILKNYKVTI